MFSEKKSLKFSPTDFVALTNQVFETAFGFIYLYGEVANLRISKNKWVYFDLKDDTSKVACFGSVYSLPGPIENGMLVELSGRATMHPQFGFNFTFQTIKPSGEGSIKKAHELLKNKLLQEGLFDDARKRRLPYPPTKVALVTSATSAAYADFIKILTARWPFIKVKVYNSLVQGDNAPTELVGCITSANQQPTLADVLVVIRGGGSPDDLGAFNDERVARALAASRIPTLVAIGHETDESLAELVADKRASTPSNAAELIAPDRHVEAQIIRSTLKTITGAVKSNIVSTKLHNQHLFSQVISLYQNHLSTEKEAILAKDQIISGLNPTNVLNRGYSVVRQAAGPVITNAENVTVGSNIHILLAKGSLHASVNKVSKRGLV